MDDRAAALKEKGNAYFRQKHYKEALQCYYEAVQVDPAYADAWYNLGMTCRALGYRKEAVTCFKKAEEFSQDKTRDRSTPFRLSSQKLRPELPVDDEHPGGSGNKQTFPAKVPVRKKQPRIIWVPVIIVLVVLVVAFAAILPLFAGTGGAHIFPFSGGSRAEASGPLLTAPAAITQGPATVLTAAPATTSAPGVLPKHYEALMTGAVEKSFPYVLRGKSGAVNITMYRGVYHEIDKENPYSYVGEKDRYQKFVDLPVQDTFLVPLADSIREKTSNPDDQVRIAVSLVQQVPYDHDMTDSGAFEIRYPYQTLYDNKGVCCEKSVLLAYLLKELGYGVALLDFENEQHTAVGIRAPPEFSYKNSGYAFIETTTPLIITNGNGDYPEFGKIQSRPEVLPAGDGKMFGSVREEWEDAREWERLNSLGPVLGPVDYARWQSLCKKYGVVPGSA